MILSKNEIYKKKVVLSQSRSDIASEMEDQFCDRYYNKKNTHFLFSWLKSNDVSEGDKSPIQKI